MTLNNPLTWSKLGLNRHVDVNLFKLTNKLKSLITGTVQLCHNMISSVAARSRPMTGSSGSEASWKNWLFFCRVIQARLLATGPTGQKLAQQPQRAREWAPPATGDRGFTGSSVRCLFLIRLQKLSAEPPMQMLMSESETNVCVFSPLWFDKHEINSKKQQHERRRGPF